MYKIVSSTEQIESINLAFAVKENNPDTKYCEINSNATRTKFAIPINENLLRAVSNDCPFITDEWLTTDLVNELPADWLWHMPEKPIRIILDNTKLPIELLAGTPFSQLIMGLIDTHKTQTFPEGNETFIYVAYIDPKYQDIINDAANRGIIKLETLNT